MVRSRGAEVGASPDAPRTGHRARAGRAGLLVLLALAAACRSVETKHAYPDDLYSPNYVKRSRAVAQFAAEKDRRQLPEAFRLLLDPEANVRLLAYLTIRDLSPEGEDFGYRPYLPEDVRIGIVARWEAWWRKGAPAEAADG